MPALPGAGPTTKGGAGETIAEGWSLDNSDQERSAKEGRYKYTQDLLRLEAYRPSTESAAGLGASLPGDVGVVRTPLRVVAWEVTLRCHPNREFVGFLLRGIAQGLWIRFDRVELKSAKPNMPGVPQPVAIIAIGDGTNNLAITRRLQEPQLALPDISR